MITAICEITARITNKKSGVFRDIVVACPIFDDKQVKVYRDNYWQVVPFSDGIRDKVFASLRGWLPSCLVDISTRELEYPSTITCGDSHQEIVRDIVSTLLNQLI